MLNIVVYQMLIVTNVPLTSAALSQFMQCVTLLEILVDTGLQELYLLFLVTGIHCTMCVKRHMCQSIFLSVSISGAEINLTVRAASTGVLCCNLAESKSVLKRCISKHCHEVTGFLLWIGTYCISCVVQQRSRVKDCFLWWDMMTNV